MFSTSIDLPMIEALRKCPVPLHLTGSRYFGGFTEKSDYDFFCEDTEDNRATIASLGKWTIEEMTLDSVTYKDVNCSEVWIHYSIPNIHIQFVKNVDRKLEVQTFLRNFPFSLVDKRARRDVWNWAYRVAPRA